MYIICERAVAVLRLPRVRRGGSPDGAELSDSSDASPGVHRRSASSPPAITTVAPRPSAFSAAVNTFAGLRRSVPSSRSRRSLWKTSSATARAASAGTSYHLGSPPSRRSVKVCMAAQRWRIVASVPKLAWSRKLAARLAQARLRLSFHSDSRAFFFRDAMYIQIASLFAARTQPIRTNAAKSPPWPKLLACLVSYKLGVINPRAQTTLPQTTGRRTSSCYEKKKPAACPAPTPARAQQPH